MDFSVIVMYLGFFLAAYSVVGNDVIQTLGTFLTSNEKITPWWVLWIFAGSILSAALIYGFLNEDISYGRLTKYEPPEVYYWYYLLPPAILLVITRFGIPVSTTFMILTLFSLQDIPNDLPTMVKSLFQFGDKDAKLAGMILKSVTGYVFAFLVGLVIYLAVTRVTERYFLRHKIRATEEKIWIVLQWGATGFLWFQWLTQDLANMYCYLDMGQDLSLGDFIFSLFVFIGLLGLIFYNKGGRVQEIVRKKINTSDIRSATMIDFIFGLFLFLFKENILGLWEAKLPMSTTWVFIGLLAGRELGVRLNIKKRISAKIATSLFADLGKISFGLIISIVLVFAIKLLSH